ncbi:MAG: DNA-binding domain-containing protein [Thiobacillus sp.]|nr:DNA-binding domain-containing protein [Thiobacillus sp.]MDP1925217.1 DNA-binding domain-containing protein [Thiobacillus sp.]
MPWQRDWMTALYGQTAAPGGLASQRDRTRFAVYQASVTANLTSALRDTYPVVNRLTGSDFFAQTARGYFTAHPSTSGDLHDFGGAFAAFLDTLESVAHLPYLPDVARLEWRAHQAFHAADGAALTLGALAALPPERYADLRVLPAVRTLASRYPVHRIWQVNQPDWRDDARIDLDSGGVQLAVTREDLNIVLHPLSEAAFLLTQALEQGQELAAACEGLLTHAPGADIGVALHELIAAGLLAAPNRAAAAH